MVKSEIVKFGLHYFFAFACALPIIITFAFQIIKSMWKWLLKYLFMLAGLVCSVRVSAALDEEFWNHMFRIEITTENGEIPFALDKERPEGQPGHTITNNEYVYGQFKMFFGKDSLCMDSGERGMKFRVRGNTSGLSSRPPYKVKFEKKCDPMNLGYKDKEWNLMNTSKGVLNFAIGKFIGELVGMEWQPEYIFAHLFINGEYRGLYMLTESVKKDKHRVNVSDEGYIAENDVYYWGEDIYFKTLRQRKTFGYTFKYPNDEDLTDSVVAAVRGDMAGYEDAVFNFSDLSSIADVQSLAGWYLAHDLLGTGDALGANMYVHKYSLADDSKLKYGPLWDFDTIFEEEGWSRLRKRDIWYSVAISQHSEFNKAYRELWQSIEPTLYENLCIYLDSIADEGQFLNESFLFASPECRNLYETIDFAKAWFKGKIDFVNTELDNMIFIDRVEYFTTSGTKVEFNENTQKGLYVRMTTDSQNHHTGKLMYVR